MGTGLILYIDLSKIVLSIGKLITLSAYIKYLEISNVNNSITHLRALTMENQY